MLIAVKILKIFIDQRTRYSITIISITRSEEKTGSFDIPLTGIHHRLNILNANKHQNLLRLSYPIETKLMKMCYI